MLIVKPAHPCSGTPSGTRLSANPFVPAQEGRSCKHCVPPCGSPTFCGRRTPWTQDFRRGGHPPANTFPRGRTEIIFGEHLYIRQAHIKSSLTLRVCAPAPTVRRRRRFFLKMGHWITFFLPLQCKIRASVTLLILYII